MARLLGALVLGRRLFENTVRCARNGASKFRSRDHWSSMGGVSKPKHLTLPLTRRIAILAIVVAMPFSGMASAVQPQARDAQGAASAVSLQSSDCCGERHQPCGPQGKNCLGMTSGCAQGCGQVQTIDRACIPYTAMEPSRLSPIAPVATLVDATSPDGQWRPPRAP